jgi:hypothetical protein
MSQANEVRVENGKQSVCNAKKMIQIRMKEWIEKREEGERKEECIPRGPPARCFAIAS